MGTAILVRTDYSSKECRGLARRLKGVDLVHYHSRERVRSLADRFHPYHRRLGIHLSVLHDRVRVGGDLVNDVYRGPGAAVSADDGEHVKAGDEISKRQRLR